MNNLFQGWSGVFEEASPLHKVDLGFQGWSGVFEEKSLPFTKKMWEIMSRLDGPPHLLFCADSGAPVLKTPNAYLRIVFPTPTPKSVDFPSESCSTRKVLGKETRFSLVRERKSWKMRREPFSV